MLVSVFFGNELVMAERPGGHENNVWIYIYGASEDDIVNVRFSPREGSLDGSHRSFMLSSGSDRSTEITRSNILTTPPSSPQSGSSAHTISWEGQSPSSSLSPRRRQVLRRRTTFVPGRLNSRSSEDQNQSTSVNVASSEDPRTPRHGENDTSASGTLGSVFLSPESEDDRNDISAANTEAPDERNVSWNYQSPSGSLAPRSRNARRRRAIFGHRRRRIVSSNTENESNNSSVFENNPRRSLNLTPRSAESNQGWNNLDVSGPFSPRGGILRRGSLEMNRQRRVTFAEDQSLNSSVGRSIVNVFAHGYNLRPRPTRRPVRYPDN